MKKNIYFSIITLLFLQSCGKNVTNISKHNSNESHNEGQNCMSCHVKGGEGEGRFTVAGTVYDSLKVNTYPNAIIELYTGTNGTGTVQNTIEVDAKGNFYTTENIKFGNGLYPSVTGSTSSFHMLSPLTSGQCNNCHGNTTNKIWIK